MYLEASDHACPHLREQRPVAASPQSSSRAQRGNPGAGAPTPWAAASAAPSRDDGLAPASVDIGGWWAFAAQARTMTATA